MSAGIAMRVPIAVSIILLSASALADTESAFILPSGVKVTIVEAPFDKAQFEITNCVEGGTNCLIRGKVPFGVTFGLPKTYIKSISVVYHNQSYMLDSSDMYDAWGSRPLERTGVIRYFGGKCFDSKNCQFRGLFSDASGSFVAEWQIVNGLAFRTVLSSSHDIVGLFMKHIDPPVFE